MNSLISLLLIAGGVLAAGNAAAFDAAAAEALARKSGCFKCHGIDKKKDGPAYKEVAAKNKTKPGIEQKFIERLQNGTKVKIDGNEEDHDPIKTKDVNEIRNVVQWILSL